jgi:transcription initiation factor IIE alpha subunit
MKHPHSEADLSQFEYKFTCPKCGQVGASVWEKSDLGPSLVRLSEGFHERLQNDEQGRIEVVCEKCGAVVPPTVSLPKLRSAG